MSGGPRTGPSILAQFPGAEKLPTHTDTAHIQVAQVERFKIFTDNQLGTAATDIHDKAFALFGNQGMRYPEINETSLFLSADNRYGMAQGLAGFFNKTPRFWPDAGFWFPQRPRFRAENCAPVRQNGEDRQGRVHGPL